MSHQYNQRLHVTIITALFALMATVLFQKVLAHGGVNHLNPGAVPINYFDGGDGDNELNVSVSQLKATGFSGVNSSYANNDVSSGSAWGLGGDFWVFKVTEARDVTIKVVADEGSDFQPGISLWATGFTAFNGGKTIEADDPATTAITEVAETSSVSGMNTPYSFNAVGTIGSDGTAWMSGIYGNMIETIAYANAGAAVASGGWSEPINHGVYDVSLTDNYEAGVTGTVSTGIAQLDITSLNTGWYAVFVGGADSLKTQGSYTLTVGDAPAITDPDLDLDSGSDSGDSGSGGGGSLSWMALLVLALVRLLRGIDGQIRGKI